LSLILSSATDSSKSNSWQGVDKAKQNSGRVMAEQIMVVEELGRKIKWLITGLVF
jgi:hypothetical protein